MNRILAIIIVFISILLLPYWLYLPILVIAIIFLPFFWEGILLALLSDILYGSGIELGRSILFSASFLVLALLIILLPIRKRLRLHDT